MMVYGVLCAVLSISFGAIIQIIIILLQISNISRVQASLPPGAEDEIIVIEHLPGRRVHLQDFFWTDAEDAPPWMDPNHRLTLYETKTIRHTLTIYSAEEEKDIHRSDSYGPKCTTCIEPTPKLDDNEDQNVGVLLGEDPGPRYWLLTVLRAGEAVPSEIELRLARLYRTAFLRQQQRHLGLLQTNSRSRRIAENRKHIKIKPDISAAKERMPENLSTRSLVELPAQLNSRPQMSPLKKSDKMSEISKLKNVDNFENYNESIQMDGSLPVRTSNVVKKDTLLHMKSAIPAMQLTDINENETGHWNGQYFQDAESYNSSSSTHNFQSSSDRYPSVKKQILDDIDIGSPRAGKQTGLRLLDYSSEEKVFVRMQNTSVIEGGATRLIYSVHLGGKPVPAETAAGDMALLSPQEVALELGTPVIIQSKPYLKETPPLALSRKRDAWLLIGAASAGFVLLALVLAGLIVATKRKRTHSAVAVPSVHGALRKEEDYIPASINLDNATMLASEMEVKTGSTIQGQTSGSLPRTPDTPESSGSPIVKIHDISKKNNEEYTRKARESSSWEHSTNMTKLERDRSLRTDVIDTFRTLSSADEIVDRLEIFETLKDKYTKQTEEEDGGGGAEEEEATTSPYSYLSMASCKQFPSMKSVEPLSRILEPVMVKHLDIDSPEMIRRDNGHTNTYTSNEVNDKFLSRTSSVIEDPGVVGPIVWNLRKQTLSSEGNDTSETDADLIYNIPVGPVGRARRRLHDLLEDSFSLFGSRNPKSECKTRMAPAVRDPDVLIICSETKGSTHVSSVLSPTTEVKSRPSTSLPRKNFEENNKNEHSVQGQPRAGWTSRPLSAGPFHRPNLPEIDTERILSDYQLSPEDSAVPLITSIKKELEKFSSQ